MPTYAGAVPMLVYADAPAAIRFLTEAFGFEVVHRLDMPDGSVGHCELSLGTAVVMLSSEYPSMGLKSASHFEFRHCQVMVPVADANAHHTQALAAGATVAAPPEDQFYGDRIYRAVDPEGHRWIFSEHVRDVPVEEWQAAVAGN